MTKGFKDKLFIVVIIVLAIGFVVLVVQWAFKLGGAQFAQISKVAVCQGQNPLPGYSIEDSIATISISIDRIRDLSICGYLETDGRPAEFLITVRDTDGRLIYEKYDDYYPGYIDIPFEIPEPSEENYEVSVFKGHMVLAKINLGIIDP